MPEVKDEAEELKGVGKIVAQESCFKPSSSSTSVDPFPVDRAAENQHSLRKVKLLCSFGGKILPRPSDGTLRYAGGHTRIIVIRRDASLAELYRKMADVYCSPVAIRYQLPDEDLDALITVSSAEDLENMMDEYDKLAEASVDGSAKLRVFLFSPSELASAIEENSSAGPGLVDLYENEQKYIEAVNGYVVSDVGRSNWKESTVSFSVSHNLDAGINETKNVGIFPAVSSSALASAYFDPSSLNLVGCPISMPLQETLVFPENRLRQLDILNKVLPTANDIGRLQIIKNIDLEELQELGSGTFGTVYYGKWRGSDVAIKRINNRCFAGKSAEEEKMRDDFWNEASKLADLHHPNVLAFYGVVLDGPGGSFATVTEYMINGSLRNALHQNDREFDQWKRLLIAMDVAFGMEYLHGRNIVHFDLKSDNLLVNLRDPQRPICKVGDLGLSKVKCQTLISGGVRGTLPWMAPELLNGSSNLVSEKVDVFSFGIVMWEILTGHEPYSDLHYGTIIGGIVSNTLRPEVPESCDPEWRALMEQCWAAEPSERPSFTEIANRLRSMAAALQKKEQEA
ncbi:hypothetical protein HPP92_020076 [Vanilla planifolia]|uniref:Protein kinase domain-containing protein n=1 Tax=Vanilla planifolia TaxID=51239 RepID=A0A835QA08_VANPL|nr:hypothetical protein HPP92_020076 [Vanilla planifolia]